MITYLARVICDFSCPEKLTLGVVESDPEALKEFAIRIRAERLGWRFSETMAACPACAPKLNDPRFAKDEGK